MAEAIPFGLAQKIIERLSSVAFEEIGSIWGVKGEFENLKNTFSTIQAVLQDAEQKQDTNNQVRDWLMKLRDVAYDVDDVLSDFTTEDLRRRVIYGDKMAKKVRIFFSNSNQLAFRFKMAHKIKVIRGRLDAIESDRHKFQFVERPLRKRVVTRERDQTHSFILEEEVIGREDDKETIIDMLLNIDEEGPNVSFISIVGIGGLGKTTLAQYVYNDEKVKTYFNLKIWVCISDVFDVKTIAEKILGCATGTKVENFEMEEQVQIKLREKLNQKYLLVLDDVWNDEAERWSNLKRLLMGGSKGSKVMITTRSNKVAEITSTISSSIFLEGLSENQSWSLLKKMAFKKGQESINPKLKEIGMYILVKCYGVPLAIKIIGSVLYFNETEDEWSAIKDELTNVTIGENSILPILKVSYDHLPSHLKCCFAYCSVFPKDYEIQTQTLIQLWIAHGFIQSLDEKLQLEDVANEYCMDLLWRSFFQEVEEDEIGNIISFKMHDLIHDIAQLVSRFEFTYVNSNEKVVNEKVRHLSFEFYDIFEKNISFLVKAKKTRKFILTFDPKYPDQKVVEESSLKRLISSFRCLRALDLHGLKIVTVPNSIDKLKYLKYLDLSKNDFKVLPSSIIRLVNLQTLKLSGCIKLKELPKDIQKMVNLKHLEIDGCQSLTHMPCGLGKLSLQTLPLFIVSKDLAGSSPKNCGGLAELNTLSNLRGGLHIKNLAWLKDATAETKLANLKDKKHLRILKLSWNWESNDGTDIHDGENLLEGLQPHHTLKHLEVRGYRGVSLSNWLPSLTNLVKLEIWQSVWKHVSPLYQLPSLRELYLKNMVGLEYISDREITDEAPASLTTFFPALKSLKLWDCPNLMGWWRSDIVEVNIDDDKGDVAATTSTPSQQYQPVSLPSFPCLSYLYIRNCMKLTCMPLFPHLEEGLILSSANLKPLQLTMAMKMNMTVNSSLPSSSSSTPPLSNLESLSLFRMQDIESLSEEWLQNLTSLQYLEIWACPKLKSLSRFMQPFTSLKKLEIGDCEEIDLISDVGDRGTQLVTSLQELKISTFPYLMTLPEWIGNLTSLRILKIDECPNLRSLPEWIDNLRSLIKLEIYLCHNLASLPEGMGRLINLDILEIIDCPHLKERCQEGVGVDWHTIAHIRIIRID